MKRHTGHTVRHLVLLVAALLLILSCGDGSEDNVAKEETKMIFDFDGVTYPVRLANLQRNSHQPVQVKSLKGPLWSKEFGDVDESLQLTPYSVLVGRAQVGVVSHGELLVYDSGGAFKFMKPRSNLTPVVFGSDAMAYVDPSYLLYYENYSEKEIGESRVIPELEDWAVALLFRPYAEELISVVQFTGGPQRKPPRYYASRFVPEGLSMMWSLEGEGALDEALLTSDEKSLVLMRRGQVRLFNAGDGTESEPFETGLEEFIGASLDMDNNLVILGEDTGEETAGKFLRVFSLSGDRLWEFPVADPRDDQPPACGSGGRVYLVDLGSLKCIEKGEEKWAQLLESARETWITITQDDYAVVVNGNLLCLFNPEGEKLYEQLITEEDETFEAPAAIDAAGRVYIASSERLYCFK